MKTTGQQDIGRVDGYREAVARYGRPIERLARFQVSLDTLHYWELVTQRRTAEVVMALRRPDGSFVVHTKNFYPQGAYRLMTGGIHTDEHLLASARREAFEETGQQVIIERFLAVIESIFEHEGAEIVFTSYMLLMSDQGGQLAPVDTGEEISAFRCVSLKEMPLIAQQLESLDGNWIDWGRFRALPHRLLFEILSADGG